MESTPFAPTTHVITTTRSREGDEPNTNVLRETHYDVAEHDHLLLAFSSVVLERGGYGDSYRETVRLQRYQGDFVIDAVLGLLQHCADELRSEQFGSDYRRRCESFLQRAAATLPAHVLEAAQQPRLTVVISTPQEA